MTDNPIQDQNEVAGKPADQVAETRVGESTATQVTQDDPFVMPERLKTRYKSVEDIETYAKQKQSEADTYRARLEAIERSVGQPVQQKPSSDEILDQIAKDPLGFISNQIEQGVAPLKAQIALAEFARTHPNFEAYRLEMRDVVLRNPAILNDPEGLEMAYGYVDRKHQSGKATEAAQTVQAHKDKVEQIKRTDAFVESSTNPQRTQQPIIKPGMSPAEMDKALDEAGIGWITDDERHRPE